ncbi:MAG: hypothetical protein NTW08_08555 [Gammaproteobacteria bacterium]|nr:hypothetical protein [Gammaproteobacteria bacterium]
MKRAFILCLFSMHLHAVGLGDMTIHSHLNEPFSAEIALIDVGNVPLSSLKPGLGTTEALDNAGLTQELLAAGMQLAVVRHADGSSVIKLVSEHAIKQASLELLIDLAWPQGEVYRAYPIELAAVVLNSELPSISDWLVLQAANTQVASLTQQQHALEEKLNAVLAENKRLKNEHAPVQHGHVFDWMNGVWIAGIAGVLWLGRRQWIRKQKQATTSHEAQATTQEATSNADQEPTSRGLSAGSSAPSPDTPEQPPLVKSPEALETLLELSKTYFSRGDFQTAKQALKEALAFGDEAQQTEAELLLQAVEVKSSEG